MSREQGQPSHGFKIHLSKRTWEAVNNTERKPEKKNAPDSPKLLHACKTSAKRYILPA
jgi:hypothetical protein